MINEQYQHLISDCFVHRWTNEEKQWDLSDRRKQKNDKIKTFQWFVFTYFFIFIGKWTCFIDSIKFDDTWSIVNISTDHYHHYHQWITKKCPRCIDNWMGHNSCDFIIFDIKTIRIFFFIQLNDKRMMFFSLIVFLLFYFVDIIQTNRLFRIGDITSETMSTIDTDWNKTRRLFTRKYDPRSISRFLLFFLFFIDRLTLN